jgi:hypothetical protein
MIGYTMDSIMQQQARLDSQTHWHCMSACSNPFPRVPACVQEVCLPRSHLWLKVIHPASCSSSGGRGHTVGGGVKGEGTQCACKLKTQCAPPPLPTPPPTTAPVRGSDMRIDSMRPPVLRPNTVPRSYTRLNSTYLRMHGEVACGPGVILMSLPWPIHVSHLSLHGDAKKRIVAAWFTRVPPLPLPRNQTLTGPASAAATASPLR